MDSNFSISRFCIDGFLKKYDVDIEFPGRINIMVGENGLGKTTILNSLYYVLSGQFNKLSNVEFKRIRVYFAENDCFEIAKDNIGALNLDWDDYRKREFVSSQRYNDRLVSKEFFIKLEGIHKKFKKVIDDDELDEAIDSIDFKGRFKDLQRTYILKSTIENQARYLRSKIKGTNNTIFYFPTYRRIEEELSNIGSMIDFDEDYSLASVNRLKRYERYVTDVIERSSLIQFGMHDVDALINEFLGKIKDRSVTGYRKFMEDLLHQFINQDRQFALIPMEFTDEILTRLDIVIDRIGLNLSRDEKKRFIDKVVNRREVLATKFLVESLLKTYEGQEYYDKALQDFSETCNSYFTNKKYVYDKKALKLFIQNVDDQKKLSLSQLSSGEKQIVSIFSKIFLNRKSSIVLFDEPELSLSMFWQKKILVDIMNSQKCSFMFAVTHSPFIFDNELAKYTFPMSNYIKVRK